MKVLIEPMDLTVRVQRVDLFGRGECKEKPSIIMIAV